MDLSPLYQIPSDRESLQGLYHFTESELALIRQRRRAYNRLGFAALLSLMKYPGDGNLSVLTPELLTFISQQLGIKPYEIKKYGSRDNTEREHLQEIRDFLGISAFTKESEEELRATLLDQALFNDDAEQLGERTLRWCQDNMCALPEQSRLETFVREAISGARQELFCRLTESLTDENILSLESLCRLRKNVSFLVWLKEIPPKKNSSSVLSLLEKLKFLNKLNLPYGNRDRIPQHRLKQLSEEGLRMRISDLKELKPHRRTATLFAAALEQRASIIDMIIRYHEAILENVRSTVKKTQEKEFTAKGKPLTNEIKSLQRAAELLLTSKKTGQDPFELIEKEITWNRLETAVTQVSGLTENIESELQGVGKKHPTFNRYMPKLIKALEFSAAPGSEAIISALKTIAEYHSSTKRKTPSEAPTSFVPPSWKKEVLSKEKALNWKMYELCVYTVLKDRLRTGDIWVEGAREFRSFDADLVRNDRFRIVRDCDALGLPIYTSANDYISNRIELLTSALKTLDRQGRKGIPGVKVTDQGLSTSKSKGEEVPEDIKRFINRVKRRMPRIKITDLVRETDEMTSFSDAFTHLKNGQKHPKRQSLWSVILADGINLGLQKMSEAISDISYDQLSWTQGWYTREATYKTGLAVLTNAQSEHAFSRHWGDGTTSSSDGQRFATGSRASATGAVNPKYGSAPGRLYYTHISDQYAPFHSALIEGRLRDSTYVLDGLISHEANLSIEKHSTDTAGFTDHVFGLTHLLGFSFQPRIKDVGKTKLYAPKGLKKFKVIGPQVSSTPINTEIIKENWDEILRIAYSVKEGTVKASSILKKLGGFPRANRIANALSEIGRIERTLFFVQWYLDEKLRRNTTAILNKGEARNSLARAVHFHRHGEIRDVKPEQQLHRATGLTLLTAVITYWNTVQIDKIIESMRNEGIVKEDYLKYLSPLGWDHINLTGDYIWK